MALNIKSGRLGGSSLLGDDRGLSTVEYVVILILVAAVAIGSWSFFGHQVKCALGMANDTVAAGIGAESTIGAQACAKGTPPGPGTGTGETGGKDPVEPPKKKVKRAAGGAVEGG